MSRRAIVLDANILIRAVLGQRVRKLLLHHAARVSFFAPDAAYDEARRHLPPLLTKRGIVPGPVLAALDALQAVVRPLQADIYAAHAAQALARIAGRDPEDWPALACALALNCPIWTEDADFFGAGVATWTTATVELYLGDPEPGAAVKD